jgi:hypothetical protein
MAAVVLGEAVADFEHWLQSCRDNGRTRYSMSAVVRAYESLQYGITLWREFPEARPIWAAKLRDLLAITSAPAMHGGRQPVSANSSQLLLRSNAFVQDSGDDASDSSGRKSDAPILISSSSAEEDLQPYEDANADDDVYDADSIIDECVRKVSVDHDTIDIWAKIEKTWPELFIAEPLHTFIHKCTVLGSAVDENKGDREHFLENLNCYLKTYDEVNGMGFQETDACICACIMCMVWQRIIRCRDGDSGDKIVEGLDDVHFDTRVPGFVDLRL